MTELAKKLNIDTALILQLESLNEKQLRKVAFHTKKCSEGCFSCLKKDDTLIRLAVILSLAVRVKEKYASAGISEQIYYDTMSDIRIWCENNGNKGLKNYGWLKNHVSFELFRLGRLQFQLYECNNKTLLYNKLPFSFGERLIYVHIPQGERLEKEKCIEAFKQANMFFSKHFPDYKYRYYFCESWLLFNNNRDFMDPQSNIIAFSSLFTHCYSVKLDAQAIDRIFKKRRLLKKNYPESTSLQKRAKEYMLKGNSLGTGIGVVATDNFS